MVAAIRTDVRISPDPSRVIARPFLPGSPAFGDGESRLHLIVERVLALTAEQVQRRLAATRPRFERRHENLDSLWESHAREALGAAGIADDVLSGDHLLLLGSYFTLEYALESAAICNPSMAPAPEGQGRFIMTLRAIGEGHISSVEFRTGSITGDRVTLDEPTARVSPGARRSPTYEREPFLARLREFDPDPELVAYVFEHLDSTFSLEDLDTAISRTRRERGISEAAMFETVRLAHWVATSNYEVTFAFGALSGRVLVPAGPADSRGIEDVRLVRFEDEDGAVRYLGTYTAFDGFTILPQLIETTDFHTFRISTMSGSAARNKGMALFPRRISGDYVALGRIDRESLFVMRSDRLRSWERAELVYPPTADWELVQVGNCGPPIETEEGWLVLTHGVGPMRTYAMGAILLDLERPEHVIGRLEEPLLEPDESERNGYVPNVVYSCGGLAHEGKLVIPYGFSDWNVGVAVADVDDLLDALVPV
ncbi:MAG: glycoside hydrolase family 130 protein [Actinomycetota bacterium]